MYFTHYSRLVESSFDKEVMASNAQESTINLLLSILFKYITCSRKNFHQTIIFVWIQWILQTFIQRALFKDHLLLVSVECHLSLNEDTKAKLKAKCYLVYES